VKIETPWHRLNEKGCKIKAKDQGPSLKRKRKTAGKLLAVQRFKKRK